MIDEWLSSLWSDHMKEMWVYGWITFLNFLTLLYPVAHTQLQCKTKWQLGVIQPAGKVRTVRTHEQSPAITPLPSSLWPLQASWKSSTARQLLHTEQQLRTKWRRHPVSSSLPDAKWTSVFICAGGPRGVVWLLPLVLEEHLPHYTLTRKKVQLQASQREDLTDRMEVWLSKEKGQC